MGNYLFKEGTFFKRAISYVQNLPVHVGNIYVFYKYLGMKFYDTVFFNYVNDMHFYTTTKICVFI
jgi:hypothetical protein